MSQIYFELVSSSRNRISKLRGFTVHLSRDIGDFQQCGMCDQQSFRLACAYAQSDQSLCQSLEYSMSVKLLIEHHLEFLSLNVDCTCSSESTHVKIKMPHCWKSHDTAHMRGPRKFCQRGLNADKIFCFCFF